MDIEKKKTELLAILAELDTDIQTLRYNIAKAQFDLASVHTLDDANQFDETHYLEGGLKYIRLFWEG